MKKLDKFKSLSISAQNEIKGKGPAPVGTKPYCAICEEPIANGGGTENFSSALSLSTIAYLM